MLKGHLLAVAFVATIGALGVGAGGSTLPIAVPKQPAPNIELEKLLNASDGAATSCDAPNRLDADGEGIISRR